MRQTNNGCHFHARAARQSVFHFARIDIESAGDNKVLLSIDDEHVSALVDARDIAGMQPAISNSLTREFRPTPVVIHRSWRARTYFTWFAGCDLSTGAVQQAHRAVGDRQSAGRQEFLIEVVVAPKHR